MMDRARRPHETAQRTLKIILQRVGVRREYTPRHSTEEQQVCSIKILRVTPTGRANREGGHVLIPDLCSATLAHLDIVSLDTDFYSLTKLMNNCCSSPWIVSVCFKYSSVFLWDMRQSCLNSWIVIAEAGCLVYLFLCD